jgi:hypothetical protein
MGRGPPGLRSTMDWPPSPTGGAHRSSTDRRPCPRKLAATAREERGARRVRSRASPEVEQQRGGRATAV